MAEFEITDYVINLRPIGRSSGLMPTWGLSAEGTRIGTVWETERGYAGQIEGADANGDMQQYTCPELPFRSAVVELLEEMARRLGIA